MNFLEETMEAIEESGHKISDVMFIGSYDGKYRMKWDKFKEKANFEYYSGWGSQSIATDLIIYFYDNTYITRGEYDGAEWWEYNKKLIYSDSDEYQDFDILGGDNYRWKEIEEMNDREKYDEDGYLKEE